MSFNKFDESTAGKIRPRFNLQTPLHKEEIMEVIHRHSYNDPTIISSKYSRFIRLSIPKKEQHTWSPVLNLSFEQQENRTYIRCLIGPSETVWQTLMLFYIAFSILGFFGSIFSLVRWKTNNSTEYLFIIPLTIFILTIIFIVSRIGRAKARLQMLHLLRFLRKAVDEVECYRVEEN